MKRSLIAAFFVFLVSPMSPDVLAELPVPAGAKISLEADKPGKHRFRILSNKTEVNHRLALATQISFDQLADFDRLSTVKRR